MVSPTRDLFLRAEGCKGLAWGMPRYDKSCCSEARLLVSLFAFIAKFSVERSSNKPQLALYCPVDILFTWAAVSLTGA
jgi:hypothetical protein